MNPKLFAKPAAVISFLIAVMILISWICDGPGQDHLFSSDPSVKFNTALCLALSATALYFLDQEKFNLTKKLVSVICSLIVLLIAVLTLSEYVFHVNNGIDQLFLKDSHDATLPGRMNITTSLLFFLLAFVHLLLHRKKFQLAIQIILVAGFVMLALIFLVSISVARPAQLSVFRASTLHTSFAFLLLFVGSFFSFPLSHLHVSFEKRIIANFSFVLLLLAIVFFSFIKTNQRTAETTSQINKTSEVLLKTGQISIQSAQMQGDIRGYFITGEDSFLASFNMATSEMTRQIEELKTLTGDNPLQQRRIDSLEKLTASYIQSCKALIELDLRKDASPDFIRKATRESLSLTNKLSGAISTIQEEETRLLDKYKTAKALNNNNSARAIALFQIVIALLLILSFVVVFTNARKRKRAEEKILQMNLELEARVEEKTRLVTKREKQYRFLIENMQEGIQVIGFDWRYLFVNKAFLLQRGKEGEDLIGHTMMEKNPGIEDTELFRVLQKCMHDRLATRMEYGSESGHYELSIEPVPEGVFILSMDITERKRTEEILKQSEAELAKAHKIARLTRWEWVADHGLVDPYGQIKSVLEWPEHKKLNTRDFLNLIHPEDRAQFKRELQVALDNGTNLNTEFRIYGPGEKIKYLHVVSEINYDQENNPNGFTGTIQDVSELKRSEAMLKQLNINLEKRAQELRVSNSELERFAYVASHDLQEPLRMVSSFLSLLKTEHEEHLDDTAKAYIAFAVDGAERMKTLIAALLEFARLGVNRETMSDVDCNKVVENVRQLMEFSIRENKARIIVKPLPIITGVGSQLQQLFLNLISNAIKYRYHDDPEIEIGCERRAEKWIFYVKDNGIGIDPKYFEKIFIIFQRLHDKTKYSGTGIGLAICKKIVERHGGNIWVRSEAGRGSTFYFSLPATQPDHTKSFSRTELYK